MPGIGCLALVLAAKSCLPPPPQWSCNRSARFCESSPQAPALQVDQLGHITQATSNPALVILYSSINKTESCHKGTQQVSFICSILSLNGCGREARQKLLRFFSFRGEGYPPFALSLTEKIRKQNSEIGILNHWFLCVRLANRTLFSIVDP